MKNTVLALILTLIVLFADFAMASVTKPELKTEADIPIGNLRTIEIHRAAGTQTNIYFHEPILALLKNNDGFEGWPPPVFKLVNSRSGKQLILIKVLASQEEIKPIAKEKLSVLDATHIKEELNGDISLVRVLPWPTEAVEVSLVDKGDNSVLAKGSITSIQNKNVYDILLTLEEDAEEVKNSWISQPDLLELQYRISYEAVQRQSGRARLQFNATIRAAVNTALVSNQNNLSEVSELFLQDRNRLEAAIEANITASIFGDASNDVLTQLAKFDARDLFTQVKMRRIDDTDEAFRAKVAEYLQPLTNTDNRSEGTSDTTTRSRENSLSVGMKGKIPSVSFGQKNRTEKTFGVKTSLDETTNSYVPTEIEVYQLKEDWQESVNNMAVNVSLFNDLADSESVFSESISVEFTEDQLPFVYEQDKAGLISSVPKGAMFCFFGAGSEAPQGYVWADGEATFPSDDSFYPAHLQGANVPNMENNLARGTNSLSEVGSSWSNGYTSLPANIPTKVYSVENSNAYGIAKTVPDLRPIGITSGDPGEISEWGLKPAAKVVFRGVDGRVSGTTTTDIPSNNFNPKQPTHMLTAKYQHNPNNLMFKFVDLKPLLTLPDFQHESVKLDLSTDQAAPDHYKCRWILRL